jgi:hypothetical protein
LSDSRIELLSGEVEVIPTTNSAGEYDWAEVEAGIVAQKTKWLEVEMSTLASEYTYSILNVALNHFE